ncbi:MAG TPA: chromate transporter, partial [Candidatus Butyricicoccus stercorigallinarum]|nr:chromate transporter [Candidatus Butyricicoccus stercorigallinarum]
IVIIVIIATCLTHFAEYPVVQHAFAGIRIAVCALVTKTLYTLIKKNVHDAATLLIFVLTFCAVALLGISPVAAILVCGLAGVLLHGGNKKGV